MNSSTADKTCLHLVMQCSVEALDNCLLQMTEGDAVLFLDDGVMTIARDYREIQRFLGRVDLESSICFSAVDLEARGLSTLAETAGVAILTDSEIAVLLQTCDYCLTWK